MSSPTCAQCVLVAGLNPPAQKDVGHENRFLSSIIEAEEDEQEE